MSRPYSYFLNVNSSEILRGCSSDTASVYNILAYLFTIVTEIITMILIGSFIIYTEPGTAMGILLLMCVVMLGMIMIFKPAAKRAGNESRTAETLKGKAIYQAVSGIKEIYVMQRKKLFVEEYENASDIARKAQRTNSFITNSPDRIIEGICVSGLVGIICIRLFMDDNMIDFVPKLAALDNETETAIRFMRSGTDRLLREIRKRFWGKIYHGYTVKKFDLHYSAAKKRVASELMIFPDADLCPTNEELKKNKVCINLR